MIGGPAAPGTTLGAEHDTSEAIERAASALEAANAPAHAVERLLALRGQVGQPCVVAVVGLVNAGKSTFINALLGEDRAVVGSTETTATINHFVYGEPDPDRPVRCYWRGGRITEETNAFLASLQGKDRETLERAEGLDRLEYLVANPLLQTLSIVDTPGWGAVVEEHGARTADFLDLEQRLRERHDAETVRIHEAADAIIYLVGAIARASDQDLLEQFSDAGRSGAKAMNALGVIGKIDLSPTIVARRHELAAKIRSQLEEQLNDVVPVSAALARAVDRLSEGDGAPLRRLFDVARRIPGAQLELLLQNEELFCDYDPEDCPVPASERREVWRDADCGWRVFATILSEARQDGSLEQISQRLRDLAGFEPLRRTLREHFLERAQILRCHRIVRDARGVMQQLWFDDVLALRRHAHSGRARLDRFLGFVDRADGDPDVAEELRTFLRTELDDAQQVTRLEDAWKQVDLELARLARALGEYNADFAALQALEAAGSPFSPAETEELRSLLGMYGTDPRRRVGGDPAPARCVERQLHWRVVRDRAPRGSARASVADRAHARLGLILDELERAPAASAHILGEHARRLVPDGGDLL